MFRMADLGNRERGDPGGDPLEPKGADSEAEEVPRGRSRPGEFKQERRIVEPGESSNRDGSARLGPPNGTERPTRPAEDDEAGSRAARGGEERTSGREGRVPVGDSRSRRRDRSEGRRRSWHALPENASAHDHQRPPIRLESRFATGCQESRPARAQVQRVRVSREDRGQTALWTSSELAQADVNTGRADVLKAQYRCTPSGAIEVAGAGASCRPRAIERSIGAEGHRQCGPGRESPAAVGRGREGDGASDKRQGRQRCGREGRHRA
jgi:hypothetical protein